MIKYFRDKYNIFIVVFLDDDSENPVTYEIYKIYDTYGGPECIYKPYKWWKLDEWDSAEQHAIDYVMRNLI